MLVVSGVARDAPGRDIDLALYGRAVTALAIHLLVLAGQRIVRLGVVIERHPRPLDRIMAGRAGGTETSLVNILLLVTRPADRIGIQEGGRGMTLYTCQLVMLSE